MQPAVSVSNAGQLALDLLIQSTKAIKLGNIWHEALIPLIGAHPFEDGSTDMCSEFEGQFLFKALNRGSYMKGNNNK